MKNLLNKKMTSGFSLVESLVYITIFLLLSGGALGLLFSLNELFMQYKIKQALLNSGTSIMERVLLEIREADSVVVADSVLASSTAGIITLLNGTETIKIQRSGNELELYKDGVLKTKLQAPLVEVIGTTFYHYEMNGTEFVRARVTLRSALGTQSENWEVTGGAIVRGSYANAP